MAGDKTPLTLGGQEESWQWRDHRIVYSVAGQGAPLILLHSINAAAWAFEFRHNIEPLGAHYRVYAPDLPGFGRSERRQTTYTADLYIEFIIAFARYVKEREGQAPAFVGSSLPGAYTIAAAQRDPASFGPLILNAPTGLERLEKPASEKGRKWRDRLAGPFGNPVFWLLTCRPSMRVFLGRDGYYDKSQIGPELVEGYHKSARQPNAKYAPISFVTFLLNHNVREEWPALTQPVLITWGAKSNTTPPSTADLFLKLRPQTELKVFDNTRLAVYDERAGEFNRVALDWLARHSQPEPAQSQSQPEPAQSQV